MKDKRYRILFVTASNHKEGTRLAQGLVREKLAACVNVLPNLKSFFWWQGKVESSSERLLIIKSHASHVKSIVRWVKAHHSYSVPEVISLPILEGNSDYLRWIKSSLR